MKTYETIDGKWWLFIDDKPVRELTDKEAAWVIWGGIIMTKDEALSYCYEHRSQYLSDAYAMGEGGQRQFDCLIGCIESGYIKPEELAGYGMDYDDPPNNPLHPTGVSARELER